MERSVNKMINKYTISFILFILLSIPAATQKLFFQDSIRFYSLKGLTGDDINFDCFWSSGRNQVILVAEIFILNGSLTEIESIHFYNIDDTCNPVVDTSRSVQLFQPNNAYNLVRLLRKSFGNGDFKLLIPMIYWKGGNKVFFEPSISPAVLQKLNQKLQSLQFCIDCNALTLPPIVLEYIQRPPQKRINLTKLK